MDDTTTYEEQQKPEGFHLDSPEKVEWYLAKVAELQNRKIRVKAQAQKMLDEIDTDLSSLEGRFQDELRHYCLSNLDGKRKRINFFNGTVSFRTVPGGVKIEDDLAFMDYARTDERLSGLILTKEVLDKKNATAKAKQILEEYGECLPGTTINPAKESMSVSFGKTDNDSDSETA